MCRATGSNRQDGWPHHAALICRGPDALVSRVAGLIEAGLAAGEPTAAIFPSETLVRLRTELAGTSDCVRFEDMTEVGRNPGRILPLLQRLSEAQPGPLRILGQPAWPERSEAELLEVMRNEVLLNFAHPGPAVSIVCVYDIDGLEPSVVAQAERHHPMIVGPDGSTEDSPHYRETALEDLASSLEAPSPPVEEMPVTHDLSGLRRWVLSSPLVAPLAPSRRDDLILAINEAATNALEHGDEPRLARLWRAGAHVVAEVVAGGRIDDPLVGRRRPAQDAARGRGVWIINQVCDLVQLCQDGAVSRLRLHMRTGQFRHR